MSRRSCTVCLHVEARQWKVKVSVRVYMIIMPYNLPVCVAVIGSKSWSEVFSERYLHLAPATSCVTFHMQVCNPYRISAKAKQSIRVHGCCSNSVTTVKHPYGGAIITDLATQFMHCAHFERLPNDQCYC